MPRSLKWRFILYATVTIFSVLLVLPTLTDQLPPWYGKIIPSEKIHRGLDLQGGMHLILEVEAEKAVESYVERIRSSLREDLKGNSIPFGKLEREKNHQIVLEVSGEKAKWEKILSQRYPMMQELSSSPQEKGIWKVVLVLDSRQAEQVKKNAIDQALETIRNRIDQFGVSEPEITLQGTDRILIQLPGIKDPQRAIDLIGRTALLEFKLLDEEGDVEAALKGNIPEGDIILYHGRGSKTGGVRKVPFLLKEDLMTGEYLKDARVSIDSQFNEPYVAWSSMKWEEAFEQITALNCKKRLAIILDDNVYSAPVIQERIPGGRAQITGRFDMKEAEFWPSSSEQELCLHRSRL
jgi:preprotein translocase subunit SecD